MYLHRFLKTNIATTRKLTSILTKCKHGTASNLNTNIQKNISNDNNIEELINKYEDQVLYNSVIEQQKLKLGYRKNKAVEEKITREHQKHLLRLRTVEPLPVSLKYFNRIKSNQSQSTDQSENQLKRELDVQENSITHFPYDSFDTVGDDIKKSHETNDDCNSAEKEVAVRNVQFEETKNSRRWMTDYENYDDRDIDVNEEDMTWKLNYGTPDPNSAVSNVPCGGCGSLLHCKDSSIPGYVPSEIFKNSRSPAGQHLRTLTCQRCHFLKNYDMALQVRVSPEDYPKILRTVKNNRNALVILMVDLLDFPCSIWPNIIDIIGRERPVIVVGNKVDLLAQDSRGYLKRIKQILADSIHKSGLARANIQDVSLISAKTGYGVEELITKLHSLWGYKGDVYLVGCTNVGKSTLYNVLLQSDYCKIKAVDLVQRATTSIWPGTTLNLLKFPILRPSGWRLFVRTKRLISLSKIRSQEDRLRKSQLRTTQNPKYATLIGHIERTFTAEEPVSETNDIFSIHGHSNASGKVRIGINEHEPSYKLSKWCYDTPGVIQPDQILHLLTTEELMLTLPKQLIQPRTYNIKPGNTIFIGGLGRLDYLEGSVSIRFTVFASDNLPVTICSLESAENIYKEFIGTELFKVPVGNKDRLEKWPPLVSGDEIKLTGVDWDSSCADIILSSAGWISVALGHDMKCSVRAWTPEKRGIYVRDSILSKAVTLRGRRIRFSPAYKKSRFFVN